MSEGQIYFLQEQRHHDDARDVIKIGWSRRPGIRVDTINCASSVPLKCLALVNGSRQQEQDLHKMLSPFRVKGGWFAPSPAIWQIIKSGELPEIAYALVPREKPRARFTIEVYEGEEQVLRKMKNHSFDVGLPFRDFAMEAIREKLEREGALSSAEKLKKK